MGLCQLNRHRSTLIKGKAAVKKRPYMPLHLISSTQSMHKQKTSPQAQFAGVGVKLPTYLGEIENNFALHILSKDKPPQRDSDAQEESLDMSQMD
jgi:hypothetical protein